MRTMIVIILLMSLAFVPTFATGEHNIVQTNKDIVLNSGNPTVYQGNILANTTDNITINWKQGNLNDATQYIQICISGYGNPAIKWSNKLSESDPSNPANPNWPKGSWLYYATITGPFTSPASFWIIPSGTGLNYIWLSSNSALTLNITITKGNYFIDRETTLRNITQLQNQVNALQSNMTNAQTQIQYLTHQVNSLNTTINNMNNTQKQMLVNITNLWMAFDKLNVSLNDLTKTVNNLNISSSQNYSLNISRLEQNITQIKADLYDIQNSIEILSKDKNNIQDVQDHLNNTLNNITAINNNITQIKNTIPKTYNDTALKNQIAQLQKENTQLKTNIETLNHTKSEKTIQKEADNKISYGAIALGIVALIVGIVALMSRMPKTPTKDDSDENPISKDYDEVEEKPKDIPKAKAKKKDDEDLDDVMNKLKE